MNTIKFCIKIHHKKVKRWHSFLEKTFTMHVTDKTHWILHCKQQHNRPIRKDKQHNKNWVEKINRQTIGKETNPNMK